MGSVLEASNADTGTFFDAIFGDLTGYLYIATKVPANNKPLQEVNQFHQEFFEWPAKRAEALNYVNKKATTHEVYFAPAIFREPSAKKEAVRGTRVFWCEFDGSVPEDLSNVPEPSIRVRSSISGHEHWYWQLENTIEDNEIIEHVNRALTYVLDADASGWDASQILRPIGTINHKRGAPVAFLSASGMAYDPSDFAHIPSPPPPLEAPVPDSIPAIEDVIPKYQFAEDVWDLFKNGSPKGDRSEALMSLGYYLCEMQLHDDEVFSLLLNADDRWGKFAGRSDQYKRLMEIVVRARVKYPAEATEESFFNTLIPYGFDSLTKVEINVDWVYEGLLHDRGYMLVTGPSGVGKTQFSLEAAEKAVLGQNYLGFKSEKKDTRILVLSLEMSLVEIKEFVNLHRAKYSPEEIAVLNENLHIIPVGEPVYFTQKPAQDWLETMIKEGEYNGVIIDSLGSMTEGSLSEEANTKGLMDWNDRLRNRLGVFSWFIHHHRKPNSGNSTPNDLGDVYGSQYITARASSVVSLWELGSKGTIKIKSLKTRFSKKFTPFEVTRDENLMYHPKVSGITISDTTSKEFKSTPKLHEPDNSPGFGENF